VNRLGGRLPGQDLVDQRLEFIPMLNPIGIRRKPRVTRQLGAAHHIAAEALPFPLVLNAEQHRGAIGSHEWPVRRD
jgi:hypothetical protein